MACGLFEFFRDVGSLIDVVELEFEDGDDVARPEELLGIAEAGECPGIVVVEEAGLKMPTTLKR